MAKAYAAESEYYAANMTYGNLAYKAGGYVQPETLEEGSVKTEPRRQSQVKLRQAAATRISPARALLYTAGFAVAAVLLVLVLLEYVQLTALTDETGKLQGQLAELNAEEERLRIAYESEFNLTEIEDYARNTLGMTNADSSQIHYLDTDLQDKAVVLKETETEDSFWGSAKEFFSSILEYFR